MSYRFPVEASHILMFARAIGDTTPEHTDIASKEMVAPPTFPMASAQFDPDYFLRPKPGKPWMGSAKEPTQLKSGGGSSGSDGGDETARALHAEQHFEYTRAVRPGDVLTPESKPGKKWEKEGRRGGKLRFNESITEFRDQNGELVVTARNIGVITEKAPAQ